MTETDNLATAHAYLAALSSGAGPDQLSQYLADEFSQEEYPNPLAPEGATRDLASVLDARARGLELLRAERFDVVNALACGDHVAMELIWTATVGRARGPFIPGQQLRARIAAFLEFREGVIVRQRNYDCHDPV